MRIYNRKLKRNVDRQIHFGVGKSVKTACGLVLFSRYVLVNVVSDWDGAVITADLARVTCKRCLATRESRLRKLLAIESVAPGIFDRSLIVSEDWLLAHALDVSQERFEAQRLTVVKGEYGK